MRDLERWALRIGGIVIVLKCDLKGPESPSEAPTCHAGVRGHHHGVPLSAPTRFQIHHQDTEELHNGVVENIESKP